MLTASKPNVFTRHKEKPRSSNSLKKISLTIEELAVSFKLNNPGVFLFVVIKLGLGTSEQV